MKGVVFTELLEFTEETFGDIMVDDIISDSHLPHGGAYTSVGTYDFSEMRTLITMLAQRSGKPVPELLLAFGRHLSRRFAKGFPMFFEGQKSLFDFLESVEHRIHVEVHKLYPDAELPSFETHSRTTDCLQLDYRSCRPLASLAEGLILGAADYYGTRVAVTQENRSTDQNAYVRLHVRIAA